jgi:hypothetical protein
MANTETSNTATPNKDEIRLAIKHLNRKTARIDTLNLKECVVITTDNRFIQLKCLRFGK